MSSIIVARFDNQFAAASASDKLLSRGMQRSHVVSYINESVGNSAASSSVPTSIISRVGKPGQGEKKQPSELRSPSHLPAPATMGHAVLAVDPGDEMAADDVRHVLELAGATSIDMLDMEAPVENPSMWPEQVTGLPIDVARAIRASKGSGALGSQGGH
ncbi:hypothetical protein [Dyella sp. RRB7]|uniref:hypothetical protein n=1 Tax=Dyella sp. RRB7 TaxID=2919502 RepID=UPI001FAA4A5C|nr:hypothetical protein [Dyella sp. RRB7]